MNLSRTSGVLKLSRSNIKYLKYTYHIVMNLKQLTHSVLMSSNYTSCKQPFPPSFQFGTCNLSDMGRLDLPLINGPDWQ